MPPIGTCFRFYTQMRVEKKKKLLPIKRKTVYTTVHVKYLNLGLFEKLRNINSPYLVLFRDFVLKEATYRGFFFFFLIFS
jgi:hypothetical protein